MTSWIPVSSILCPVLLAIQLASASDNTGDATTPDFVSDCPGLILSSSQQWGEMGINTAAHPAGDKRPLPIQIADKTFANGLGSHASGEIVLLLEKQYVRFDAEIGVQQQASSGGSVIFRTLADGVEIFKSARFAGTTPAQSIGFSVEEVTELRLLVEDAGDGIACDLGNWANARLTLAGNASTVPDTARNAVDMAPFARVATWDPKRTDGARASRIEEFRADDVFTESDLQANPDGSFTVPAAGGTGCIGLQWLNSRAIQELGLEFAEAAQAPPPGSVKVEGWFGESAWQGNWQPLPCELRLDGRRLVCIPNRKVLRVQTRKIRWIFPEAATPQTVRLSAFTRSTWDTANIFVQMENPPTDAKGIIRIDNGALLEPSAPALRAIPWSLAGPLKLSVRHSRPSPFKSDPTVLQFELPSGNFGVAVEDLMANDCVYLPDHGLFAAREPLPVTLTEYKKRISGRKSILDEVRRMPDQTFAQAMAKTHHTVQREGPVLLSLACDNAKFIVDRTGGIRALQTGDIARENYTDRLVVLPRLGSGGTNPTRWLDGKWLPIPVMEWREGGVQYRQRTFVAPTDEPGDNPVRLNRPSVCVVELTAANTLNEPQSAAISLALQSSANAPVRLESQRGGWLLKLAGKAAGFIQTGNAAGPLLGAVQEGMIKLAGTLPAKGTAQCVVILNGEGESAVESQSAPKLREATEAYWKAVLAAGAQVETPDALLNDIIRASEIRCLIAGRNEADGARIAAWIAAVTYGPLESESHSPIRGMELLGFEDFARKSLDFFIHRYNKEGFLTTGYTTFGTAWHLWTVGEHYQLTGDKVWLKKVAPELARLCHWIVRQTEKTRKLDPHGKPVPEHGLMPPGVLADWNSFAYHFFMNAYYIAALREVGAALQDLAHPDAPMFLANAEEMKKQTLRAYAWTRSRSPALPLRDGTWIAHYPSQVHSPGSLAGFFPGQDVGRSWCYDVEAGAHQLIPAGVLAPHSREAVQMLNHMEDVQFLADGWFDYPTTMNQGDWFNNGGFSKVQPYYTRNGEIYAMQDEVKPFIRSYFNSIASLLNPEVLTFWEHFRHSGAWDKTHETGYFLQQTRFMLAMEHGQDLWLAPLITDNWLKAGLTVSATGIPTRFGKVSFRINSHVQDGRIDARIEPPVRSKPGALVLRLRHPEGKPMRSVTVNGRPHTGFDPKRETITLPPGVEPLAVQANF
ncbi:MAG: NPCBM/NEW2 domain-containing protein [Verrucomicrobiales bacterium]|nr:NPCBM/NEW2 domain-containing protein [Verrucomicrobiales bacterium]